MTPITIKDIEKRVWHSVTTVSHALHDYDDVNPETKEIVRQAAAEKRFAFIADPDDLIFTYFRNKGFLESLAEHNIPIENNLITTSDLTQHGGYAQAKQLLSLPPLPDAIVASNNLMAPGTIIAAQEKGLIIGKDISITGFDDTPMAEYSFPR